MEIWRISREYSIPEAEIKTAYLKFVPLFVYDIGRNLTKPEQKEAYAWAASLLPTANILQKPESATSQNYYPVCINIYKELIMKRRCENAETILNLGNHILTIATAVRPYLETQCRNDEVSLPTELLIKATATKQET